MASAIAFFAIAAFALSMFFWPRMFRWDVRRKRAKDPEYVPPRVLGVLDEVFHPEAHAASQIQEAEHVIPAPAPLPGDRPFTGGRITIDLDHRGRSVTPRAKSHTAADLQSFSAPESDHNSGAEGLRGWGVGAEFELEL